MCRECLWVLCWTRPGQHCPLLGPEETAAKAPSSTSWISGFCWSGASFSDLLVWATRRCCYGNTLDKCYRLPRSLQVKVASLQLRHVSSTSTAESGRGLLEEMSCMTDLFHSLCVCVCVHILFSSEMRYCILTTLKKKEEKEEIKSVWKETSFLGEVQQRQNQKPFFSDLNSAAFLWFVH